MDKTCCEGKADAPIHVNSHLRTLGEGVVLELLSASRVLVSRRDLKVRIGITACAWIVLIAILIHVEGQQRQVTLSHRHPRHARPLWVGPSPPIPPPSHQCVSPPPRSFFILIYSAFLQNSYGTPRPETSNAPYTATRRDRANGWRGSGTRLGGSVLQ